MAVQINVAANQAALVQSIQAGVQAYNQRFASQNQINLQVNARAFSQPLGRITGDVKDFEAALAASNARVIAFGASTAVLGGVIRSFKGIAEVTIEVEKNLADINRVFGLSTESLQKFSSELFNVSKLTASSFKDASQAALEFSRQGLKAEEVIQRTTDALTLSRLAGLNVANSIEALTATVNSFKETGISTTEVLNKLVAVEQSYAVSAGDLAEALSRTGLAAQEAGVDIDQLNALVTAAQEKTARGGAVIGNALKTIFTRVQSRDTLDALESYNILVRDAQGNTLPAISILQNFAKAYQTLGDVQKNQLSQQVAGIYQVNILKAVLSDLNSTQSAYAGALMKGANATNEAQLATAQLNQTLDALLSQTSTVAQQFANNVGKITFEPLAKEATQTFKSLFEGLNDLIEGEGIGSTFARGFLKGIRNIIAGPGAIGAFFVLFKLIQNSFTYLTQALPQIVGITTETQNRKNIEQAILQILQQQGSVAQALEGQMGNQTAQAQLLLQIARQQTAEYQRQQQLVSSLAPVLAAQGVTAKGQAGLRVTRSDGYLPTFYEETSAKAQGASSKVKAVEGVGKIGGKSFVANNEEMQIPNFAGTGETAVIPTYGGGIRKAIDMIGTGKSGSILNRGFVPNFARSRSLSQQQINNLLFPKTYETQKGTTKTSSYKISIDKLSANTTTVGNSEYVDLTDQLADTGYSNSSQNKGASNGIYDKLFGEINFIKFLQKDELDQNVNSIWNGLLNSQLQNKGDLLKNSAYLKNLNLKPSDVTSVLSRSLKKNNVSLQDLKNKLFILNELKQKSTTFKELNKDGKYKTYRRFKTKEPLDTAKDFEDSLNGDKMNFLGAFYETAIANKTDLKGRYLISSDEYSPADLVKIIGASGGNDYIEAKAGEAKLPQLIKKALRAKNFKSANDKEENLNFQDFLVYQPFGSSLKHSLQFNGYIPNFAVETLLPGPKAIRKILSNQKKKKITDLDFDGTISENQGNIKYLAAKTQEERDAVLNKYFRNEDARMADIQNSPLTSFGAQLLAGINNKTIDPNYLGIMTASDASPRLMSWINKKFRIPKKNIKGGIRGIGGGSILDSKRFLAEKFGKKGTGGRTIIDDLAMAHFNGYIPNFADDSFRLPREYYRDYDKGVLNNSKIPYALRNKLITDEDAARAGYKPSALVKQEKKQEVLQRVLSSGFKRIGISGIGKLPSSTTTSQTNPFAKNFERLALEKAKQMFATNNIVFASNYEKGGRRFHGAPGNTRIDALEDNLTGPVIEMKSGDTTPDATLRTKFTQAKNELIEMWHSAMPKEKLDTIVQSIGARPEYLFYNADKEVKRGTEQIIQASTGFIPNFAAIDRNILRDMIKFNIANASSSTKGLKNVELSRSVRGRGKRWQSLSEQYNKNIPENEIINAVFASRYQETGNPFFEKRFMQQSIEDTIERHQSDVPDFSGGENFKKSPFVSTSLKKSSAFAHASITGGEIIKQQKVRLSRILNKQAYSLLIDKHGEEKVKETILNLSKLKGGKGIGFDVNDFLKTHYDIIRSKGKVAYRESENEVAILSKGFIPNFAKLDRNLLRDMINLNLKYASAETRNSLSFAPKLFDKETLLNPKKYTDLVRKFIVNLPLGSRTTLMRGVRGGGNRWEELMKKYPAKSIPDEEINKLIFDQQTGKADKFIEQFMSTHLRELLSMHQESFLEGSPIVSTSTDERVADLFATSLLHPAGVKRKLIGQKDFKLSRIINQRSYKELKNKYGEQKVKETILQLSKLKGGKGIGFDVEDILREDEELNDAYSYEKEIAFFEKGFMPNFLPVNALKQYKKALNRIRSGDFSISNLRLASGIYNDKTKKVSLNKSLNRDEASRTLSHEFFHSIVDGLNLTKKLENTFVTDDELYRFGKRGWTISHYPHKRRAEELVVDIESLETLAKDPKLESLRKKLGLTKNQLSVISRLNEIMIAESYNSLKDTDNGLAKATSGSRKRAFSGFLPNFATDYINQVMNLESNISGNKAVLDTQSGPFPFIRNSSQANFAAAISDHGGLNNALSDSLRNQKNAGLMSNGYIPNFAPLQAYPNALAAQSQVGEQNMTKQAQQQLVKAITDQVRLFAQGKISQNDLNTATNNLIKAQNLTAASEKQLNDFIRKRIPAEQKAAQAAQAAQAAAQAAKQQTLDRAKNRQQQRVIPIDERIGYAMSKFMNPNKPLAGRQGLKSARNFSSKFSGLSNNIAFQLAAPILGGVLEESITGGKDRSELSPLKRFGGTAASGILTGLSTGAAIGSAIPVIGTAAGAAAGAIIGLANAAIRAGTTLDDYQKQQQSYTAQTQETGGAAEKYINSLTSFQQESDPVKRNKALFELSETFSQIKDVNLASQFQKAGTDVSKFRDALANFYKSRAQVGFANFLTTQVAGYQENASASLIPKSEYSKELSKAGYDIQTINPNNPFVQGNYAIQVISNTETSLQASALRYNNFFQLLKNTFEGNSEQAIKFITEYQNEINSTFYTSESELKNIAQKYNIPEELAKQLAVFGDDVLTKNDVETKFFTQNMLKLTQRFFGITTDTLKTTSEKAEEIGKNVQSQIDQITNRALESDLQSQQRAQDVKTRIERRKIYTQGRQKGGLIYAENGAYVPGFGTGDKVPAMLEPGEVVINRRAVNEMGVDNLLNLNSSIPRFGVKKQKGGLIGFSRGYQTGGVASGISNNVDLKSIFQQLSKQVESTRLFSGSVASEYLSPIQKTLLDIATNTAETKDNIILQGIELTQSFKDKLPNQLLNILSGKDERLVNTLNANIITPLLNANKPSDVLGILENLQQQTKSLDAATNAKFNVSDPAELKNLNIELIKMINSIKIFDRQTQLTNQTLEIQNKNAKIRGETLQRLATIERNLADSELKRILRLSKLSSAYENINIREEERLSTPGFGFGQSPVEITTQRNTFARQKLLRSQNLERKGLEGDIQILKKSFLDTKTKLKQDLDLLRLNMFDPENLGNLFDNFSQISSVESTLKSLGKISLPDNLTNIDSLRQYKQQLEETRKIFSEITGPNNETVRSIDQQIRETDTLINSQTNQLNALESSNRLADANAVIQSNINKIYSERISLILQQTNAETKALTDLELQLQQLDVRANRSENFYGLGIMGKAEAQIDINRQRFAINQQQTQIRNISQVRNVLESMTEFQAGIQNFTALNPEQATALKELKNLNLNPLDIKSINDADSLVKKLESARLKLNAGSEEAKKLAEFELKIKQILQDNTNELDKQAKIQEIINGQVSQEAYDRTSMRQGFRSGFDELRDQADTIGRKLGHDIPIMFTDGMTNALMEVAKGTATIGDAFRDMAINFGQQLMQQVLNAAIGKVVSNIGFSILGSQSGGIIGKQNGGIIRAENGAYIPGNKTGDRNLALLEDGEYVLNREAVAAIGVNNLDGLNYGMAPRFQSGGGFGLSAEQALVGDELKYSGMLMESGQANKPINIEDYTSYAYAEDTYFKDMRQKAVQAEQERIQKVYEDKVKNLQLMTSIMGAVGSIALSVGMAGVSAGGAAGGAAKKTVDPKVVQGAAAGATSGVTAGANVASQQIASGTASALSGSLSGADMGMITGAAAKGLTPAPEIAKQFSEAYSKSNYAFAKFISKNPNNLFFNGKPLQSLDIGKTTGFRGFSNLQSFFGKSQNQNIYRNLFPNVLSSGRDVISSNLPRRQTGGLVGYQSGGFIPYGSRISDNVPRYMSGGINLMNNASKKYVMGNTPRFQDGGSNGVSNTTNNSTNSTNIAINIDKSGTTVIGESGNNYSNNDYQFSKQLATVVSKIADARISDAKRSGGALGRGSSYSS